MQVYAEYALLENFCMDFTLLYAAKAVTKNPAGYAKLTVASVLGACFALVWPFFGLEGAAGTAVKIGAGLVLAAIAGRFSSFKAYVRYASAFIAFTFLCGGLLIALFSLADISFYGGDGYIISSVPAGIPLFCALCLLLVIKRLRGKFSRMRAGEAKCRIYLNGKSAACKCFYDSGNKVYYHGSPVSVIPRHVALRLVEAGGINKFAIIHTVSGESTVPVFRADEICIDEGGRTVVARGVVVGISPQYITKAVLHPDLAEISGTKD